MKVIWVFSNENKIRMNHEVLYLKDAPGIDFGCRQQGTAVSRAGSLP